MAVCARQDDAERDALRIDDDMVFAAEFAPVRGVWACFFPAYNARTEELSTSALARSSWPRRRNSASIVSCMRCHTPALCHSSRRLQQVEPDPQPISCGSKFHARPARSTNTMPVSTARSGIGLRPAYRRLRGAASGSSGSISAHNWSSISSLGMASCQGVSRILCKRVFV
jgi:hypothetical protein